MNGPVTDLNFSDVEACIKDNLKISNRLLTAFGEKTTANRILNEFREDISSINEYTKLMEVISRPGLRERHWNEIQKVLSNNQSSSIQSPKSIGGVGGALNIPASAQSQAEEETQPNKMPGSQVSISGISNPPLFNY
jgi:hypothetical protein